MKTPKTAKRKKPDAAERIVNGIFKRWMCGDTSVRLADVGIQIRRAITAAVRADRKARKGKA